jgi:hypothetical protein
MSSSLWILTPSILWNIVCYELLQLGDIALLELAMTNKELSHYFQVFSFTYVYVTQHHEVSIFLASCRGSRIFC